MESGLSTFQIPSTPFRKEEDKSTPVSVTWATLEIDVVLAHGEVKYHIVSFRGLGVLPRAPSGTLGISDGCH